MSEINSPSAVIHTADELAAASWWAISDFSDLIDLATLIVLFGTLVVLFFTAWYARKAIKEQTAINKKRAAISLMIQMKQDPFLSAVFPIINRIHKDPDDAIELYARPDRGGKYSPEKTIEIAKIRYLLNYYETICVGINNGIYEEKIIIDSLFTTMVSAYVYTKSYIETVRTIRKLSSPYENFENRILDWKHRFPDKYQKRTI